MYHMTNVTQLGAEEIASRLARHRDELRACGVRSLALFGSAARGEAAPASDLDLLVDFDGPATFDRYMDLHLLLEEVLGRRIDLVTRAALKPRLRPTIEREAVRVA
jgi:uncharacterized protein